MKKIKALAVLLFSLVGFTISPAIAENIGSTASSINKQSYTIKGFRSAKFGQDKTQVLASIKKDFGITAKDVDIQLNKSNRTTTLSIKIPALKPFTVDGTIHYILGYKTKQLFQVNLYWVSDATTKAQALNFVESGLSLLEYYNRYDLSAYKIVQGTKMKDNIILLGLIHKKPPSSVMELVLSNVKTDLSSNKQFDVDIIKGKKPFVKISYIKDANNLDVFVINDGEF